MHSHLGSRLPAQVSSALAALLELSGKHAELLQGYSAFLTNILEYVEDFTSAQLMQVRCRNEPDWRVCHSQNVMYIVDTCSRRFASFSAGWP